MIKDGALVIYKNRAATARLDGDKLELSFQKEPSVRVREKDVELLHDGPVKTVPAILEGGEFETAWEMTSGSFISISELAELAFGSDGPAERLSAWAKCMDGLPFRLQEGQVYMLQPEERKEEEEKRNKKQFEGKERAAFIERAKKAAFVPGDERFYGELEAMAYGKSQKSGIARELGIKEEAEAAHAWLLKSGLWTRKVNPFALRSGHPQKAPQFALGEDNDKKRIDLQQLEAWAIDSPWSHDPDDALSWDGQSVWVHVADPASVIVPDSPADQEAARRSGTLYIPEGAIPMLPKEMLRHFSLGLDKCSRAMSFRIELNEEGLVEKTEVFPSFIRVKRSTYEEADKMLDSGSLKELKAKADIRKAYRKKNGSVDIDIPEVSLWLDDGECRIAPLNACKSGELVKEMMVLAGEAAARWAFDRGLPFPYYSQEAPGHQNELPPGLAGEFAKRRLMKAGMAGVQPRAHQGLGVSMYAQATSPLRRYADLLAQQQIRAWLDKEAGLSGKGPMLADELSMKLALAAAGSMALRKAERQSELHWTLVWLQDRPSWEGEGIAVQSGSGETLFFIPLLGLETRIRTAGTELNSSARLRFLRADIARQEAQFAIV
ncbi:RNB domain-containing ribonuclease [Spirochaetota bacterium]